MVPLKPAPPTPGSPAFTAIELLMAAAITLILTASGWRLIRNDLDRARLNAVSLDLAAWLEGIHTTAQRTQGGCTITVATLSTAADGTQLASVSNLDPSDRPCSNRPVFSFQATSRADQLSSNPTTSSFTYTPRGTLLGTGGQALPNQVEIRLALTGIDSLRCIRLSGLLGALQVGANSSTSNLQTECTTYARF
jgi:Tfp pilus assembly protein FimT